MYRIRFHGRGGQGMKTASRILGTAFFHEGFQVQDAPRYGAERRGAPLFATVRADRAPIHERGAVAHPDLVVVADDTLLSVAAAGVLAGLDERGALLVISAEDAATWRERTRVRGPLHVLPAAAQDPAEVRFLGARAAGAAARLLGVISRGALERAIAQETAEFGADATAASTARALAAYEALAEHAGSVRAGEPVSAVGYRSPAWVELPFDAADVSAPDVHGEATSVQVRTGLWRTMRPVIDYEHCNRCSWICSTFCPDSAITVEPDRTPRIDYDHCKGCMVCAAVCPPHAIHAVPERTASAEAVRS
jgi:pyruvate ferredoxin oxidoreductase gamma subunit